jgi:hypothetical protein
MGIMTQAFFVLMKPFAKKVYFIKKTLQIYHEISFSGEFSELSWTAVNTILLME